MKHYTVSVKDEVFADIDEIVDYIISINTSEHAVRYKNALIEEIRTLEYAADTFQVTKWKMALRYHPQARRMITKNKKWDIIFHVDGDYVIIDKLIPSKLIIN